MNPPTTDINIPVAIVVDPQTSESNYLILFHYVSHIFNLAAIAIRGGLGTRIRQLYAQYHQRVADVEEGVIMPHSSLVFIINALLALVQIKLQGQTHSQLIRLSVLSLVMYGLASAAELLVFASGLDRTSVYAIIARFARIGPQRAKGSEITPPQLSPIHVHGKYMQSGFLFQR